MWLRSFSHRGARSRSLRAQPRTSHPLVKKEHRCPLDGSVVLVTGANSGIGTYFVHDALARGAAKVYATARSPAWDDARIVPLILDVTDRALIAAAVAARGGCHRARHNAGAIPPSARLLTSPRRTSG